MTNLGRHTGRPKAERKEDQTALMKNVRLNHSERFDFLEKT